jgi:hypothetical protein
LRCSRLARLPRFFRGSSCFFSPAKSGLLPVLVPVPAGISPAS